MHCIERKNLSDYFDRTTQLKRVDVTIQDLIDILSQFDPAAKVLGTFEGITTGVDVYPAQGHILLDVDSAGDSYKKKWQSGQIRV